MCDFSQTLLHTGCGTTHSIFKTFEIINVYRLTGSSTDIIPKLNEDVSAY